MIESSINTWLLSTQVALCGAVIPELRAVIADVDEKRELQSFTFYYDTKITHEIFELSSVVSTEASCSLDYLHENHIIQVNFPGRMPIKGNLAYLRKNMGPKITSKKKDIFRGESPYISIASYYTTSFVRKSNAFSPRC